MKTARIAIAIIASLLAACGSSSSRPSDDAWARVWELQRDLVPDAQVFVDQGEELCGRLVGELRSGRQELLPTPTEAQDDAVSGWISHAESIAFDCPTDDPDRLRTRLHDLQVRTAEIDAGLAADQTP